VMLNNGQRSFSVFSCVDLAEANPFKPHAKNLKEIWFIIH
jgi:hypothetical protein